MTRVGDPILKAWSEFGTVQAQVIQALENTGSGWAKVTTGDYTIYEKDGSVAGTGTFTYAFPALVGPGGTAYLFDTAFLEGVKQADLKNAEVTARYDVVDDPGPQLEFTNLKVKVEPYGSALQASGVVKNLTGDLAASVTIGVLFYDAADHVLGAAYTNIVANVEPGAKKGFETIIGTPPLKRSAVKSIKAFGTIQDF